MVSDFIFDILVIHYRVVFHAVFYIEVIENFMYRVEMNGIVIRVFQN